MDEEFEEIRPYLDWGRSVQSQGLDSVTHWTPHRLPKVYERASRERRVAGQTQERVRQVVELRLQRF